MMGKKKLSQIKAEVASLLRRLPGGPKQWLEREIESATADQNRDPETLKMLCAALEQEATKLRSPKKRRKPAKR
jgi:hypothetical protein